MTELPEITITGIDGGASVVSVMVSEDVAYPAMEVSPGDRVRMILALRTIADVLEDAKPVMY